MRIREAAPALAVFLWAAGLFAQGANGPTPTLTTTGQVLSTGHMSLVVKADDGKEYGPFIITTTTQLAPGLGPGTRVTVFHHPVGDRQVADRVVPANAPAQPTPRDTGAAPGATAVHGGGLHMQLTAYEPQAADSPDPAASGHGMHPANDAKRGTNPGSNTGHGMRPAESSSAANGTRGALPATAGSAPLVGLLGVVSLMGRIFLQAFLGIPSR